MQLGYQLYQEEYQLLHLVVTVLEDDHVLRESLGEDLLLLRESQGEDLLIDYDEG